MINIKIFNHVIGLDLLYLDDFNNSYKYETDEQYEYLFKSIPNMDFIMPRKAPDRITDFYDLYEFDDYRLQIQKTNGEVVGAIKYVGNEVYLYMKEASFAVEYLLSQYAMVYVLNRSGGILMHGSSISYKNKGIIFAAKSGTGKSTHTRLWREYIDAVAINDDKNILSIENGKLMLYPSPWSGKHLIDNNIVSSLDCIVFLYQSKENVIKKLKPIEAMKLLLGQILLPNGSNKELWNSIIDKILELPIYSYGCNMEYEAFEVINKELELILCQ